MDELRAIFFGEVRPASEPDRTLLRRAFDLAYASHDGQLRKDGSPYIAHPVAVATDVWNRYGDTELTAAALLHDVPEDCPDFPMAKVYADFGPDVGFMVDAVTKGTDGYLDGPAFSDKIEKLLWGGMRDVRCLLLKIADRDHNLRTIGNLKEHKQIRMAFETQAIYQPLREILGLQRDVPLSIRDLSAAVSGYLLSHGITTAPAFKDSLCGRFFMNFDHDIFQVVYGNSSCVNWKIGDKDFYMRLIATSGFDDRVSVLSIREDSSGAFECLFKFKKGDFSGFSGGMSVSSFKS